MSMSSAPAAGQPPTKVTNLATVAIIAISDDVPIVAFAKELEKHLTPIGERAKEIESKRARERDSLLVKRKQLLCLTPLTAIR